jgi:superfamily II DNA or RNA helicase
MQNYNKFFKEIVPNLSSFDDFYVLVNNFTTKEKGDMFEWLTKYIFLLHPVYKTETKNIWLYEEMPHNLQQKHNLPKKDEGIDLILEKSNGDIWGIQCKFRKKEYDKVGWGELGTFIGLNFGVAKFTGAYYVTNTYNIHDNINNAENTVSIFGDFFKDLDEEFFDNLKRSVINKKPIYKSKEPRNYQIEAYEKSKLHFENTDRGKLIMACGTGKSYTSYLIDDKLKTKSTLILVPSLNLLGQFYRDWIRETVAKGINIKYILVGSNAQTEDDEYEVDTTGIVTCKSPWDIFRELGDYYGQKLVIITTYHSCKDVISPCMAYNIKIDLAIFDEAHKTVGRVDSLFSYMLSDKNFEIKKRLFMTATPRIYTNVGDDNEDILSMDNNEFYGKDIFEYGIRQAINEKRLCDYQIITMCVDDEFLNSFIEQNKLVDINGLIHDSHHLANAIMCYKAFEKTGCTHLLTYHSTVTRAKNFAKLLEYVFGMMNTDCTIYSMDGVMNSKKRYKIMAGFKNSKKSIICSARVLNEGVNIPIVDAVCFVESRNSTIDIVQCVGRALRNYGENKIAKIIIPYKGNLDDMDDDNNQFASLGRLVKSLYDVDPDVRDYFCTQKVGSNTKKNVIKSMNFLGKCIEIGTSCKLEEWNEKLRLRMYKRVDSWLVTYLEVKRWYNEHNGQKPSKHSKDNEEKRLGSWCGHQRKNKKKDQLDEDRIEQLELIVGWEWDQDAVWTNNYDEVKRWYNEHDGQKPSPYSKDNEEKRLGLWCGTQRTNKKKGKLDEDRIEQLEKIVGWEWKLDLDAVWTNNYNEVKKWYDEHDGQKPSHHSKDNEEKRLGVWCSVQRRNKKKDKLDKDKIEQLELIIGWEWELDLDAVWINNYNEVKKWYDEHDGQKPSITSKDNEEKRLGVWCYVQRHTKKKGKLDEDQIEQLELIVGWEWDQDAVWINNYNEVKKWYNDHNGQKPPSESKDAEEKRLGKWCGYQRQNKKKGKLDEDRIEQLELIVGWEWDQDAVWTNNYDEVKKWYDDHNGQKPSNHSKDAEEKRLGSWCGTQRTNKKKGKLDEDRIDQLELIVGWEWELDLDAVWINNYNEVKKWYDEHNGQKPSITSKDNEEKRLGSWCGKQRHTKKKGKLDEDQIEQLELIVGWEWDQDAVWINNYNEVKKWYNDHNGQKPPSESKNNEEKRLGKWCGYQRKNKKKDKLDENRIEQLELIIGWEWELDLDAVWINNYNEVKKWYDEHNSQKPSSESKDAEEKRLGKWCGTQRTNKKNGKLDEDRIEQLELIVGWKWTRQGKECIENEIEQTDDDYSDEEYEDDEEQEIIVHKIKVKKKKASKWIEVNNDFDEIPELDY